MVSRRDVGDVRRGHYYAVMHRIMSEDSKETMDSQNGQDLSQMATY